MMPINKGTEYGKNCNECAENKGAILKDLTECKLGHEIVIEDGCMKCGTPKRKEVSEGKMTSCSDWKPSKLFDYR
jgi:hypothetical protein